MIVHVVTVVCQLVVPTFKLLLLLRRKVVVTFVKVHLCGVVVHSVKLCNSVVCYRMVLSVFHTVVLFPVGLFRALRNFVQLGVVGKGQPHKTHHGAQCADEYEGCAFAVACVFFVGKRPEQRQHEKCQNVVQRHYESRPSLVQAELVCQHKRYYRFVSLPECTNQKKCKAYKQRAFVV